MPDMAVFREKQFCTPFSANEVTGDALNSTVSGEERQVDNQAYSDINMQTTQNLDGTNYDLTQFLSGHGGYWEYHSNFDEPRECPMSGSATEDTQNTCLSSAHILRTWQETWIAGVLISGRKCGKLHDQIGFRADRDSCNGTPAAKRSRSWLEAEKVKCCN